MPWPTEREGQSDSGARPAFGPMAGGGRKGQVDAPKTQGPLLDDKELIWQLFARLGGIPLLGSRKPVHHPYWKDVTASPNMENAEEGKGQEC